MLRSIAVTTLLALPATALACGGLFCDATTPVNQAAERILFVQDGEQVQMHVRLDWSGPPTEFGWLLPVPRDVETTLSSEALFTLLDQAYAPQFILRTEMVGDCTPPEDFDFAAGGMGGQGGEPEGAQVLSREQVGPYDRVILEGETVEQVLDWLADNEFQVPEGGADTLRPYVEMGAVFVAIKLVPGAGSQEVVPLALTFTASGMTVPMRPTANAATPDMGVIVHVLGYARAVPTNFRHVQINEGAINWQSRGGNYADVVSQAADEAGGQAFVTDYAGEVTNALPPVINLAGVGINEDSTWLEIRDHIDVSDQDLLRILRPSLSVEGVIKTDFLQCTWCYEDATVTLDTGAFLNRLEAEVNAPRRELDRLFQNHSYMTRLYTTLSPSEMDADPLFDTNPDLDPVSNIHRATRVVECVDGAELWDQAIIETSSGLRFDANRDSTQDIARANGETVRGKGVTGAAVIEQAQVVGQPQIVTDNRAALREEYTVQGSVFVPDSPGGAVGTPGHWTNPAAEKNDGCDGCATGGSGSTPWFGLLLAGVLLGRRRRG